MGNTHVKPHPRTRNKKQVRWKAAARPFPPGKPQLSPETDATPDLVTIRWSKPSGDGGSPISGYLVEHRRTGSPHWVRASPLLVQIPEITISGLEPGWRYQFRVRAENAVGLSDPSELSEPITVTLQRSAITAPRFTQELQDAIALENEKAEFVVHILGQPAPKVCWYKDGFEIFSSRRIRILTESDRSVLTIHQTALSDQGEIKCTATNRAGHVSTKSALSVEAPPSIRLPRQYEEGLLFEIGEVIRLKVSVAGRPTPLVFWSHNGESIKNNDRYEVEYIDRSSVLKINEARRTDRGEYQVKAVNKLGENTQSFLVTVTDKPSPPGRARVIMALGKSVTLSWTTPQDDGGCKIGNYIVEYYRLGWNVWLKAATSRQLSTILGDLIEGSEYKFRIKAESPYGVSDPSEESEVVFIPDPKRGILLPQPRGRSQPRDVAHVSDGPVAIRRKNKPRSQSSSRVETNIMSNIQNASIPVRPERNKIKSPPKTPELSPMSNRKDVTLQINKEILEPSERSSIARDLAYGSPEIKVKKEPDLPQSHSNSYANYSQNPRTPSPLDKEVNHKVYTVKIEPHRSPSPIKPSRSPSPEVHRTKSPRENNENFTGSSEFMLVLYPDENERDHSDFDFDEYSVPPPMSLSAPELGSDLPLFNNLKTSASSTELLHERAMMRFYQAAEAEEAELEKRRNANKNQEQFKDIPKIQINSKDDQDIVGLEKQNSFRRRMSAGGISHQQVFWAQRRHSLRGPTELKGEIVQNKLEKFPVATDLKRKVSMTRQRSESEEKEDQAFEEVRQRMMLDRQSSREKKKIAIADVEKWADDYQSSTEEDSELSEDERLSNERLSRRFSYENEEDETYHPMTLKTQPFEILTKRKDLPDPSFVPKPILKKTEHEGYIDQEKLPSPPPIQGRIKPPRSSSPRPQDLMQRERSRSLIEEGLDIQYFKNIHQPQIPASPQNHTQRERSQSLIEEGFDVQFIKNKLKVNVPETNRPRSFSLLPQNELFKKEVDPLEKLILPGKAESVAPGHSISAVAQISGITAASIVIPNKLLEKKKNIEEAKVLIDHYGDIVRNFGKRKKSNPQIYLDRDSLKKVAENIETPQTDIEESNKVRDGIYQDMENIRGHNYRDDSYRRTSLTDYAENKPSKDVLKSQSDTQNKPTQQEQPLLRNYHDDYYRSSSSSITSFTDRPDSAPRKDSLNSNLANSQEKIATTSYARRSSFTDHYDSIPRKLSPKAEQSDGIRRPSVTQQSKRERTISKSPPKQLINRESSPNRSLVKSGNWSSLKSADIPKPKRKTSPSPVSKGPRRKTSPSPMRKEKTRRVSPSPLRREMTSTKRKSESSSPIPFSQRRPMLREIMTQTSVGLETLDVTAYLRTPTPPDMTKKQEELMAKAEVKVRTTVDYITDLAMFVVACWLYLFKNELLAIPVLLVMAYRQLQAEVAKRIPKWIMRRLRKKRKSI